MWVKYAIFFEIYMLQKSENKIQLKYTVRQKKIGKYEYKYKGKKERKYCCSSLPQSTSKGVRLGR
jgi:hypothetical protein